MGTKAALLPAAAVASGLVAVLAVVPAWGGDRKPPRRSVDARVAVRDNFFSPRSLTIERGDTVKWRWKGDNRHDIAFTRLPRRTSRRGAEARRTGRWYRTFRKTGQYRYVCTIYAGMRGSVTVVAGDTALRARAALPPG